MTLSGQPTKKSRIMKQPSPNKTNPLKVLGLIVSFAALPLLLGASGCATASRHEQNTGERIDDRGTSSRVKAALDADPQYKFGGVNVETFKKTVQLNGFVATADQKARAGDITRRVEGVNEVANNITVTESKN